MFDWFMDTAMELRGIDVNATKRAMEEKKRQERESRFIFSSKAKVITISMGCLYLLMTGSLLFATKGEGVSLTYIIKSIFLSLIDIVAIVAILTGKKKGEIVALVLVFIFVVTLYLSIFLG